MISAYCPEVPALVCGRGPYADHSACRARVLAEIDRERQELAARAGVCG